MDESNLFERVALSVTLCSKCGLSVSADTTPVPLDMTWTHLPTEREVAEIPHALSVDEASAATLKEAITKTRRILDSLRAKYDLVTTSAARKRSLLAPVRRLPVEILTIIITLAISRSFKRKRDSTLVVQHPVLQVCHRWRALALATPRIWNEIVVYPNHDLSWYKTIRRCLRRSETQPLDIYLCGKCPQWRDIDNDNGLYDRSYSLKSKEWVAIAKNLRASSHRWRTVSLNCISPPSEFIGEPVPLPLLQNVNLTSTSAFFPSEKFGIFKDCPALACVRVISFRDEDSLDMSWERLTALELEFGLSQSSSWVGTLQTCASLRNLTITTGKDDDDLDTHHPEFTLPALETLVLRDSAQRYLRYMHTPRLREVTVMSADSLTALRDFARKDTNVGDTVSSLTLMVAQADRIDEEQWLALFRHYPGVSRLHVQDAKPGDTLAMTTSLVDALCRKPHLPLPKLVHLSLLKFPVAIEEDIELLECLIQYRVLSPSFGTARLQEIEVGHFKPLLQDPVAALCDTGINIYASGRWGYTDEDDEDSSSTEDDDDDGYYHEEEVVEDETEDEEAV
ncbi:hypothetical protein BD626DRAFT_510891 [Schizophyllum amplum]|uniref:Uncharacterized protein n=1 Tax=Schizophyllum amplum TaxID=97359 RepID=A0A550C1F8_9AGAR|nr:hypothetical protein BD626DRAFT_510891 [Auriculariopsis ampla]